MWSSVAMEALATVAAGVATAGALVIVRRSRGRPVADHGRALVALARVTSGRRPADRAA